MELQLYDKNFTRLGMIHNYSYAAYENSQEDAGSFTVTCLLTEELMLLLNSTEYVLLDNSIEEYTNGHKHYKFGILMSYSCDSIETAGEVTLSGYMMKHILTYRTFFPQFSSSNKSPAETIKAMIEETFNNPSDPNRKVPIEVILDFTDEDSTIEGQVTGSDVGTEIQKLLDKYELSIELCPKLLDGTPEAMYCFIHKGRDLTPNQSELSPVRFSYELSNIQTASYLEDKSTYKNNVLVAGEGEKTERKTVIVTDRVKHLSADENTLMLLHMQDLTDEVVRTFTMTKGSQAFFSNENTKFGGLNGQLKIEDANAYFQFTMPTLPADDVTFEWWEYRLTPTTAATNRAFDSDTSSNKYGARLMSDQPSLEFLVSQIGTGSSSNNIVASNTPSGNKLYNQWVHRAVVVNWELHSDNKWYPRTDFYENGVLFSSYTYTTGRTAKAAVYRGTNGYIGKDNGGKGAPMFIEEVRISSIARYSGESFTVPDTPFAVTERDEYLQYSGLSRREVFVDARDLQSVNDKGVTLTAAEYNKLLIERALDKMQDHLTIRQLQSTVTTKSGKIYEYGTDYVEGDIVSVVIEPLGIEAEMPIGKVTIVEEGGQSYCDVTFGDAKSIIKQKLIKEGIL